mgnify:FL=1
MGEIMSVTALSKNIANSLLVGLALAECQSHVLTSLLSPTLCCTLHNNVTLTTRKSLTSASSPRDNTKHSGYYKVDR